MHMEENSARKRYRDDVHEPVVNQGECKTAAVVVGDRDCGGTVGCSVYSRLLQVSNGDWNKALFRPYDEGRFP